MLAYGKHVRKFLEPGVLRLKARPTEGNKRKGKPIVNRITETFEDGSITVVLSRVGGKPGVRRFEDVFTVSSPRHSRRPTSRCGTLSR